MTTLTASTNRRLPEKSDIPSGYRTTDIGVLPRDWDVVEIGDLNPFVTSGSRGWARFYSDTGSLFVRITNLSREQISLDLEDVRFVDLSSEAMVEAARTHLEEGDILISITADIGIIGYVDSWVSMPAYMNQHIALIRFDPSTICGRYVAYSLASERPQRLFLASMDVGAKAGMSLITVRKIRFPLPPLPEQRAIAAALSDVDELIGALDKLIAKKRAIKLATMQQLLTGKIRLPGFSGEWQSRPLSELAAITMGQSPPSKYYNTNGDGLPLIQGNADLHNRRSIERVWTTEASKRCLAGDLLLTVRAPVGAVGIARKDACLGRGVCGLSPLQDSSFLFQSLVHAESRWRILEQGSTFTAANSKQVGQFELYCPDDEEEQRAIAAVLSDMDAEITAIEQRRDKTKAIKQGMMQSLLTGRVRLVKPETAP